ncbi:MAG: peptidylprolyl isomerase [Myxococcota bacterium]
MAVFPARLAFVHGPAIIALSLTISCSATPKETTSPETTASVEPATAEPEPEPEVTNSEPTPASPEPPASPGAVAEPGEPERFDPRPAPAELPRASSRRASPPLGPMPVGTLAIVDTVEIPMTEFSAIYDLKVKKYADRGRTIPPSADRRYRKSIAERLVYHEILAQRVAKAGVDYDQAALEARTAEQKRGIRDWLKHLERRGETEASLRAINIAELREVALLEQMGRVTVTDAEIDEEYERVRHNWHSDQPRVRASHILVPIGPESRRGTNGPPPSDAEIARWTKEARRKAQKLYKRAIQPKADFAELAREHSEGPSARKGGDIGVFTHNRMVESFSDKAFSMKVGQVSKPVKTKFGFHIIMLTGRWPAGDLPREALETQITQRLRQRKLHEGRRGLKQELIDAATVHNFMLPTLGPEPRRGRRGRDTRPSPAQGQQPLGPS